MWDSPLAQRARAMLRCVHPLGCMMVRYEAYISKTPGVQGGAPCIKGTRTPVRSIAVMYHVTYPHDIEQILRALPHLSRKQVEAALAYYQAHRAEVDADLERHRAALEELQNAS